MVVHEKLKFSSPIKQLLILNVFEICLELVLPVLLDCFQRFYFEGFFLFLGIFGKVKEFLRNYQFEGILKEFLF